MSKLGNPVNMKPTIVISKIVYLNWGTPDLMLNSENPNRIYIKCDEPSSSFPPEISHLN